MPATDSLAPPGKEITKFLESLGSGGVGFRALAYYDAPLDCIRVQIRETSIREERVNPRLTQLFDNYPQPGQPSEVGFVLKGVKHLFSELELPLEGVLQLTEVIDQIVKKLHDQDRATADALSNSKTVEIANHLDLQLQMEPLAA